MAIKIYKGNRFLGEARQPDKFEYTNEKGKGADKDKVTRVTVNLTNQDSANLTKLARQKQQLTVLQEQVKQLEQEVKTQMKDTIPQYFDEADAASTRVMKLKSAIELVFSKDQVRTTVDYSSILEELTKHLAPELIEILETLKNQFTKKGEPFQTLSVKVSNDSINEEESDDQLGKSIFNSWLKSFDKRLNKITRILKNG